MNLKDIAAKIDEMSLDELLGKEDLPVTGGDYDTKLGWSRRMGVHVSSRAFKTGWNKLEKAGLVERVKGKHAHNPKLATLTLYHCPALAKKLIK